MNDEAPIIDSIFKSYFKHVVWIDNQILDHISSFEQDSKVLLYQHLFLRIAKEFHEQGIGCSLKNFPVQRGIDDYFEDSDPLKNCIELAINADIIILDWHLVGDSSEECEKIITELCSSPGTRFIIIFTQEDECVSEMDKNDALHRIPSDLKSTPWFSNSAGTYIAVEKKKEYLSEDSPKGANDLLNLLFDFIRRQFQDHLHWFVMSFISQIKHCTPVLLSLIPQNTNLGFFTELLSLLHNNKPILAYNEILNVIFSNLFEDLQMAFSDYSYDYQTSVSTFEYFAEIQSKEILSLLEKDKLFINSFEKKSLSGDVQSQISAFNSSRFRSLISHFASKKSIKKCRKVHDAFFELNALANQLRDGATSAAYISFCKSCFAHSQFNETISVAPANHSFSIHRGGIFKKKDPSADIYVCISQTCDCEREPSLLFLLAQHVSDYCKYPCIYFRANSNLYAIKLKPSSAKIYRRSYIKSHFSRESCRMRSDTIDRIASTFTAYVTRVGVNLPAIERYLRNEKNNNE